MLKLCFLLSKLRPPKFSDLPPPRAQGVDVCDRDQGRPKISHLRGEENSVTRNPTFHGRTEREIPFPIAGTRASCIVPKSDYR